MGRAKYDPLDALQSIWDSASDEVKTRFVEENAHELRELLDPPDPITASAAKRMAENAEAEAI
jgi:hypothetical protein